MSALFMDSFDQYGTGTAGVSNMLDGVYANVGSFIVSTPSWGPARTGTSCLMMQPVSGGINVGNDCRFVIPGQPDVLFLSHGFAVDFLPPDVQINFFQTRNASNLTEYSLVLNPTGSISLYTGDSRTGTVLATTNGPVIRAQTWHFLEINVNYTTGAFVLRVDDADGTGTPAINVGITSGLKNAFWACTWNTANGNYGDYCYDDLFIRDDQGTVNNGWLGDRRVALMLVDGDTTTAGWTPSYYQKFGAGVLGLANMVTNNNVPQNQNSGYGSNGNSSLDIGGADFTMESFVRFENTPSGSNYATIMSKWDALNDNRSYRFVLGGPSFNSSCLQFDYTTDGTESTLSSPIVFPFSPVLNQWYHIAVVRASNELLLFVNGQQLGLPISITATVFGGATNPITVGVEQGTGLAVSGTYLTGMMDETRFTNGYARYTAPFAPPTVAFPRNVGGDPEFADVVLLAGYDNGVQDESSFNRTVFVIGGGRSFIVNDGPLIGAYSTINKAVPDDNTFISAALTNATGTLTMAVQPANGDTVTVGTTNGTTAAVYTWKTTLASAYDVLIDTNATNSLINLFNAINAGPGIGTKYGTGTLANFNVSSVQLPAGQIEAVSLSAGTGGNAIATSATGTAASWGATHLSGGVNIPGPSAFHMSRPPPDTTIISAVQSSVRAQKTDSGTSTIQASLIGPLGGVANGATHNLTISADYYNDIIERDPDTGLQITPSTLINGQLKINRTA